jgi:hypothetical protein
MTLNKIPSFQEVKDWVNGEISDHGNNANAHHEAFEPSDYNPESDTHSRYTDAEAKQAAIDELSRDNFSDRAYGSCNISGGEVFKDFQAVTKGNGVNASCTIRGKNQSGSGSYPSAGIRLTTYNNKNKVEKSMKSGSYSTKSGSVSQSPGAGSIVRVEIRAFSGGGGGDDCIDYIDYDVSL